MKLSYHALAVLFSFLFSPFLVSAQLQVDNNPTPQQLVQDLVGGGVQVSNVQLSSGDPVQRGSFDATNADLDMPEGLVLATGGIEVAIGPNDQGDATNQCGVLFPACAGNDPDLDQVLGNQNSLDAVALEFDFVPTGDSINFKYIFASEEYPEYACSNFNDAFGFFLSGPGINGPYTNGARNIAKVPGQDTAVAINTINEGPGSNEDGNCDGNCPCNSNLYVDNGDGTTPGGPEEIQFDGYTVPLTASASVECGKTYHIKLVIADASDRVLESGVFLEKESFSSEGNLDVDPNTISFNNTVIEGCTDGTFSICRNDPSKADTMAIDVGGSAIEGKDYDSIPDELVFGVGDSCQSFPVKPISDTLNEPQENIKVTVISTNDCGDTATGTGEMVIADEYDPETIVSDTSQYCPEDSVTVGVGWDNAISPVEPTWVIDSDTIVGKDSVTVPGEPDTLYVKIEDNCGFDSEWDTLVIDFDQYPMDLSVSSDTALACPGDDVTLNATVSGGAPPTEITWSNGQSGGSITVSPNSTTDYIATARDSCGSEEMDTVTVTVPDPAPLNVDVLSDTTLLCAGDSVLLEAEVSGGSGGVSYSWNTGATDSTIRVNPLNTTDYFVTVSDKCNDTDSDTATVQVEDHPPLNADLGMDTTVCRNDETGLSAVATGGTGVYEYIWEGPYIDSVAGDDAYIVPKDPASYQVIVSDQCGNRDTAKRFVDTRGCELDVPNIITPNPDKDTLNQYFAIDNLQYFPGSELRVFDRWGNLIFESPDYKNNWDGDGHAEGTYYYVLKPNAADMETITGTVTILKGKEGN